MSNLVLSFLVVSVPAQAMNDSEYRAARQRLQESQRQTEQMLRNVGTQVGFFDSPDLKDSKERPESPLFQIHTDLKPRRLKSGQLIFGHLVNRLVVGPDGSPALVELDDGQGSLSALRLQGVARQSGTPGRLTLEFQRIVSRAGKTSALQAVGLDSDGAYGLSAQVFTQKAWSVAGAMASSFVAGLAASQQTQSPTAFGFSQTQTTGRNAVLQGVAQTAADQSKRLIDEATAEKPILVVDQGSPVTILIQEEVRF